MPESEVVYWFLDKSGEVILSNAAFDPGVIPEFSVEEAQGFLVRDDKKGRYARVTVPHGVIFIVTYDKALVTSSRLFKEKVLLYSDFLSSIIAIKNKIIEDALHDLTKIHGHNIQEIYNVVPEELMLHPFDKQVAGIKSEIVKNLDNTAVALIQIIRNNHILKAEFENIRVIHGGDVLTNRKVVRVAPIIFSILYLYDQDFQNKKIRVSSEDSNERISLDYNLFVGALIPIFENILKYSKPETQLNILYTKNESGELVIRFKMRSLRFGLEEELRLFSKNVSGELAREIGKAGKGLGMHHAKSLLAMNSARIRLYCAPDAVEDGVFRDNVLDITFEKS